MKSIEKSTKTFLFFQQFKTPLKKLWLEQKKKEGVCARKKQHKQRRFYSIKIFVKVQNVKS